MTLSDEFDVSADDGSVEQVARLLLAAWNNCAKGMVVYMPCM